jgi:hypothetical protein
MSMKKKILYAVMGFAVKWLMAKLNGKSAYKKQPYSKQPYDKRSRW